MKKLWMFFCILFLSNILAADAKVEEVETTKELRIMQLMGETFCPLAVEPALPENYVAMSPSGDINLYDWVYWGPKEVLEAYFKDQNSLNQAIIRVKFSANTRQTGMASFNGLDVDQTRKELKKLWGPTCKTKKYQWGSYPVFAINTDFEADNKKTKQFMAWIGLNDPEGGWVLLVNLVYPPHWKRPKPQAITLWNTFLDKTKPLGELDFIRAQGQDLRTDCTIVSMPRLKVKVTAEKRKADGCLQVVMEPLSPGISFEYQDMEEGLLGTKWMQGAPMVKICGNYNYNEKDENPIIYGGFVTTVLLKTVESFSVNPDEVKGRKDILVYRNEAEKKKS